MPRSVLSSLRVRRRYQRAYTRVSARGVRGRAAVRRLQAVAAPPAALMPRSVLSSLRVRRRYQRASVRVSVRAACVGALLYAGYKLWPRRLLP
ncbi:hypothetical protein JYU34_016725 [Plutella xylostella]|uniref:Uncharacterized protein n=1 Tax=Plutella xylostella TaxID=51655 RepID=A0ABQ7Q3B0_PLUXY|nr:hypothetical protein JYU34_016725 [Plutella xylostella]